MVDLSFGVSGSIYQALVIQRDQAGGPGRRGMRQGGWPGPVQIPLQPGRQSRVCGMVSLGLGLTRDLGGASRDRYEPGRGDAVGVMELDLGGRNRGDRARSTGRGLAAPA